MSIVRFRIDKMLPHADATTFLRRCIVEQSRTYWPGIVPQASTCGGIESKNIIGGSHVHDAAHDHRSRLQPLRIARMENPGGAQLGDVTAMNLVQDAEATSGIVSVIRGPVADCLFQQIFGADMKG